MEYSEPPLELLPLLDRLANADGRGDLETDDALWEVYVVVRKT
jgi:hypothetical protein